MKRTEVWLTVLAPLWDTVLLLYQCNTVVTALLMRLSLGGREKDEEDLPTVE